MEWIEVNNRLPAEELTVLIATDDYEVTTGYCTDGNWNLEHEAGRPIVTHWMNLPTHPTGCEWPKD